MNYFLRYRAIALKTQCTLNKPRFMKIEHRFVVLWLHDVTHIQFSPLSN